MVNFDKPLQLKPTCMHLRHKMMYCDERQASPGMVDDTSDTRIFFCIKSQDYLGPDSESVSPTECNAARACFCPGASATP